MSQVVCVRLVGRFGRLWDRTPPACTRSSKVSVRNDYGDIKQWDWTASGQGVIADVVRDSSPRFRINICAFDRNGGRLALADHRGNVYVLHFRTNRYVLVHRAGRAVASLGFARHRTDQLVLGLHDSTLLCINTDSRTLQRTIRDHNTAVHSVDFSSSGHYAVTTSQDRAVLWKLPLWKRYQTLDSGSVRVRQAQFAVRNKRECLVTSFNDDSAMVWGLYTAPLKLLTALPLAAQYSQAGASDPSTNRAKSTLISRTISTSARGRLVVTGGDRGELLVWDLKNHVMLRRTTLPSSAGGVIDAQFIPHSSLIVVLCTDGLLRIFDFGSKHTSPPHSSNLHDMSCVLEQQSDHNSRSNSPLAIRSFSLGGPNGTYLACVLTNGRVRLVDLECIFRARAISFATQRRGTAGVPIVMPTTAPPMAPDSSDIPNEAVEVVPPVLPLPGTKCTEVIHQLDTRKTKASRKQQRRYRRRTVQNRVRISERMQRQKHRNHPIDDGKEDASLDAVTHALPKRAVHANDVKKMLPLYKAVQSDERGRLLNDKKLRQMLMTYGEYPSRYRLLIWRYLLRLPSNHRAFAALRRHELHPSLESLRQRYPMKDARLFRKLEMLLSSMAQWCALMGELSFSYLPALVFPFAHVFQHDDMVAFEVSVAFVYNWCSTWFQCYPQPPIELLSVMENVLQHHDAQLHRHLTESGLIVQHYLWVLLRTLLTEVLSRNQWLVLFDHVFSNPPAFLHYVPVAFLLILRGTLLTNQHREDFVEFLRKQHPVLAGELVRRARHLLKTTPEDLSLLTFQSDAGDAQVREVRALAGSSDVPLTSTSLVAPLARLRPLPEGSYPMFRHAYPKFVVDLQLKERERIEHEERILGARQKNIEQLQEQNQRLASKLVQWKRQQDGVRTAETERREHWIHDEEDRARRREHANHQLAAQRLQHIKMQAQNAEQFLEHRQTVRVAEMRRLDDEFKRRKVADESEIAAKREEEHIRALEFQVQQRMSELRSDKDREEGVESLRRAVKARTQHKELQRQRQEEEWTTEDALRRKRHHLALKRKERMVTTNQLMRTERDMQQRDAIDSLEREIELSRVERDRRVRQLAEDELARIELQVGEQTRQQTLLNQVDQNMERKLLQEYRDWRTQQRHKREQLLERELDSATAEAESRAQRLRDMERRERSREWKQRVQGLYVAEREGVLAEEKEMHNVLMQLEQEKAQDRQLEREVVFKNQIMKNQLAHQQTMRQAEEQLLARMHERYDHLREELKEKLMAEDTEIIRQHEDVMAHLIVQNERQLKTFVAQLRRGAADSKMREIRKEYVDGQLELDRTRQQLRADEDNLRQKILDREVAIDSDASAREYSVDRTARSAEESTTTTTTITTIDHQQRGAFVRLPAARHSTSVDGNNSSTGISDIDVSVELHYDDDIIAEANELVRQSRKLVQ